MVCISLGSFWEGGLCASCTWIFFFQVWEEFSHNFLKYIFDALLYLSSLSVTPIMQTFFNFKLAFIFDLMIRCFPLFLIAYCCPHPLLAQSCCRITLQGRQGLHYSQCVSWDELWCSSHLGSFWGAHNGHHHLTQTLPCHFCYTWSNLLAAPDPVPYCDVK